MLATLLRCLVAPIAAAVTAGVLPAQDGQPAPPPQAPEPRAVTLLVRLSDGTPVSGVPIVRAGADGAGAVDSRDGWLRPADERMREASWPVVGRTDDRGQLTLMARDGRLRAREVLAGAPFRAERLADEGERQVLIVRRLDQFAVRVRDASGRWLPHLPMALRQGGETVAFAVTNLGGTATFGVDPRDSARLVVVPYGWIGPIDTFPTVAQQLPDREVELTLPPCGLVRVRLVAGGVPQAAPLRGASVTGVPGGVFPCSPQRDLLGVELGPVALGQELRGTLRFDDGAIVFAAAAPMRNAETVVVDVEVAAPRPELAMQLVVAEFDPAVANGDRGVGVLVQVAAHTEAGRFPRRCTLATDGTLRVTFDRDAPRGQRLRRVDVDLSEWGPVHGGVGLQRYERHWYRTLTTDRALANERIDLGAVELVRHSGLLRGRVVDQRGEPVAGAHVDIEGAEPAGVSTSARSGDDGTFAVASPLLRGREGRPVAVVARASLGQGVDASHGEPCAPVPPGSEVTLVVPRRERGYVQLSLRGFPAQLTHALHFEYVHDGRVLAVDRERIEWNGTAARLGPLPPGRGELRVLLRPGVRLRSFADVVVTAGRDVADARLSPLDLADAVRVCRMRVLDEQRIPIAGARVEYRGASSQWSTGPSHGDGVLEILAGPAGALRVTVSAPGKQPVEVREPVDGGDVQLGPARSLRVAVTGLPDELPRERLQVLLRSIVRERLDLTVQAPLGANGTAALPLPEPGRYFVRIAVRSAKDGDTWSSAGQMPGDVLIERDTAAPIELPVDAATLARIRELLAK